MSGNHNKPRLWSVIQSTLAAAFGVQSDSKREKDFSGGHPGYYIVAGVFLQQCLCLYL